MSTLRARAKLGAQEKDAWATPRYWVANIGYGNVSASALLSARRAAIILWLPEDPAEGAVHALSELAVVAQQAMLGDDDGADDDAPPAVVVLDLSPLVDAAGAAAALDVEGRSMGALGAVGKPAARALDKLIASGMREVTLVACGGAAQLLLRLISSRTAERGVRPGAVRRAVLVHPRLPGACVNAHLSGGGGVGGVGGASASGVGGAERLDVLFEDPAAAARRLAALRWAFPQGSACSCAGTRAALLAHALLEARLAAAAATAGDAAAGDAAPLRLSSPSLHDPEQMDGLGRTLWLGRLRFELSRATKQHEAILEDAMPALQQLPPLQLAPAAPAAPAAPTAAGAPTALVAPAASPFAAPAALAAAGEASGGAAAAGADAGASWEAEACEVGALVLRGSRCVLVRSLEARPLWRGMAIPTIRPRRGESHRAAAKRAACLHCEVDYPEELLDLPQLPPACVYGAGGVRTDIFLLYTAVAPPPGPLEAVDVIDEADCYDWWTWPREPHSLLSLALAPTPTLSLTTDPSPDPNPSPNPNPNPNPHQVHMAARAAGAQPRPAQYRRAAHPRVESRCGGAGRRHTRQVGRPLRAGVDQTDAPPARRRNGRRLGRARRAQPVRCARRARSARCARRARRGATGGGGCEGVAARWCGGGARRCENGHGSRA